MLSLQYKWYLFYRFDVLMEPFSLLLAHCTNIVRKIIHMAMQEVYFHTHIGPKYLKSLKQFAHQDSVIASFGIAKKIDHHRCKCIPCIQFWWLHCTDEGWIIQQSSYLRSIEYTALSFSSVMAGNFTHRYLKQSPSLSSAFTNCFIKPGLMCSGGRRTVSGFTSGSYSPTTNSVRLDQSCFTQWSFFARLPHKQRKQRYFVYPPCCPRSMQTIFKSPQIFQLCSEYFNFSSTCFMLS